MAAMPTASEHDKTPHDRSDRNAARLAAVQALYQIDATQDAPEAIIKDFLMGRLGGISVTDATDDAPEATVALAALDSELFINLVRAVQDRGDDIDHMIKSAVSAEWPWERLEMTLRAVLRAGVAELLTRTDIPAMATVAEFVDVGHAFYAGPEPRMVNAVLDRVARALGRIENNRNGRKRFMSAEPTRRGEFELIAHYFAPLAKTASGAFGLTDDAAVLDITPGCQLVAKTDEVVGGVHFRLNDPPELIGRKALRVTLSDLAAKGARPIGFLQAITLNDSIDDAFLVRYADGLAKDVAAFGVPLVGGDTTSSPGPFTVAITVLGEIEQGSALLRSGAKPGDDLYVTGTIGDGALGLASLRSELTLPEAQSNALRDRYWLPQPRLDVGRALRGVASASLDVSDGLVADVGHICETSKVGARIRRSAIPLSDAARAAVAHDPKWWTNILGGGDDYEIAFTAPPIHARKLAALAAQRGIALTRIGEIVAGKDVTVIGDDNQIIAVPTAGFSTAEKTGARFKTGAEGLL